MGTNTPIETRVDSIEVSGGTKEMMGKEGAIPVQDLVGFKGRPIELAEDKSDGPNGG